MVFGLPASRRRRIEHAKTRTPEKAATKYAGRKDKAIRNGKRGAAVFSGRMRKVGCKELRYKVIYRFRDRFTVEELCKLLEVSRSGYYKWLKRKDKPDRDKIVADLIAECHEKAHRTYGYRRVKIWLLRETGLVINHKAVLRIMRKYNLLAIRKRKRFRHYDCNTYTHYANELMRDFTATRPNEKWVTDISYIQTKQGFLYLSMIKDLYDNSIVGYRYATQMPASLVIETVRRQ